MTGLMAPQTPQRHRDPVPFATWEIAVWTIVCFVTLMVVAALIQHARERHDWAYEYPQPQPAHIIGARR